MGAYAVASTNNAIIKAKVAISGFDDPISELVFFATKDNKKMNKALLSFMLRFKYFIDRGIDYNVKASKMLKKTKTHTLIIHGTNDQMVPFENISISSKKEYINNDLVEYKKLSEELHNDHNTVIASTNCVLYQKEIQKIYDDEIKNGKTPKEAREIMIKAIDVFKFNEANEELMDTIDNFYQSHK